MSFDLYHHYDKEGALLYVGQSLSAVRRLSDHRTASPWYDEITSIVIEKFSTREEVLTAESKAIKEKDPKHNILGKRKNEWPDHRSVEDEDARIVYDLVSLDPIYRVDQAAAVLKITPTMVKRLIRDNLISHVTQKGSRAKEPTPFITGWQILDYLEEIGGRK